MTYMSCGGEIGNVDAVIIDRIVNECIGFVVYKDDSSPSHVSIYLKKKVNLPINIDIREH